MLYNRNAAAVLFCITICFLIATAFGNGVVATGNGDVEGYVFPKDAGPRVELVLPNPKKAGDTIHKAAVPNAAGFFKFNNVPEGTHSLLYFPKEPALYKSTSREVQVVSTQTTKAEDVTLEKQ
jgi:hypothetical protein